MAKKNIGLKMFTTRMHREGRLEELERLKAMNVSAGSDEERALRDAAIAMGYMNQHIESRLVREHRDSLEEVVHFDRAVHGDRDRFEWDTILGGLPEQADPRKELDWVRGHPAMGRHSQQSDKTKPVRLTALDLGGAPSRAAVISLCTWVDHPYEFQKQWLGEQKKKVEAAQGGVVEGDASLGEVERLLREFRGE